MTVKIDDFKAVFDIAGFARANRYEVIFPNDSTGDLSIICDSVTWPGRQITTEERVVNMKAQKLPYAFAQEDAEISFVLGNDWYAWDYLNNWQNRIINNMDGFGNYSVNYKNEYVEEIIIKHLDNNNEIRKQVKLKGAYPTSLNRVELGNSNENEVIRVSAEFSYHNWETID